MTYADSTGSARSVTEVMTPVSPMPPTVAQNRAGSASGPMVRSSPSAVTRSRETTCVAEGAVAVVVLAVDVGGDGAADGDVAGARRDRHEEPLRPAGAAIRSWRLVPAAAVTSGVPSAGAVDAWSAR